MTTQPLHHFQLAPLIKPLLTTAAKFPDDNTSCLL